MNLKIKNEITSLELVEQINLFRKEEGKKTRLEHFNLLNVIRDEFQEEINALKIQAVEYKDKKGEKRPMFILTLSQAKQVLVRESKFVRRATIQYIEKLEQQLANPKLPFEEENKIIPTTWRGQPVMELSVFTKMTGVPKGFTTYYYKKEIITLTGNDLANYKKENGISKSYPKISLLYKDTVVKAAKLYARYEQSKNDIENYFKSQNNILEYKSNEKAFDDKYLNNIHNLMREVELAESEIERIHKEKVIPLYNKIKELVLLKKNSSMVTFYVIKYGDGTSVPK